MKKDVTAIIAVKNGERTIQQTIDSLLDQTVKLKKIIIVNDVSTDCTAQILNNIILCKYCSRYNKKQIQIIHNKSSQWIYRSRNIGAKEINTTYMFFLDADDMIDPHYIEKCLETFKDYPDAGFVYTDMKQFQGEIGQIVELPDFNYELLKSRNYIPYSAMMRTDIFREMGGYSDYLNDYRNHMTEWALWLKFAESGFSGVRCREPLFLYRQSSNQMSKDTERNRNDMYYQMKRTLGKGIDTRIIPKKILFVTLGRDYMDNSQTSWELNSWRKPLDEFGVTFCFFYDVEIAHLGQENMIKHLHEMIDDIQPDIIFHPVYKDQIPINDWIKISNKYKTICWMCDDAWRFENFSKLYSKGFRYTITTNREAYKKYQSDKTLYVGMKTHPILSQWAINPHFFNNSAVKDIDVSFLGQNYGNRQGILDGLNVKTFWDRRLTFNEMADVMRRSKISIDLTQRPNGVQQIQARPFEVTGCNTLLLHQYVKGIEQFFEIDKEIVIFNTKDELREKIDYYLEHDTERIRITKAGYGRTHSQYTWEKRFENIFRRMG